MNTLTIKSVQDYVEKEKNISIHGKKHEVGFQKYHELCPCVAEVKTDCIESVAKYFFDKRNPWKHKDRDDFLILKTIMNHVIYNREDFTDIPGSEYIGSDYWKVHRAFSFYAHERITDTVTRRQYSYQFDEKLCMNGMQIFEDQSLMILNFRSCDYIKKFPLDLLFIKILMDDFNVKCDKIYCIFGSLHTYDHDKI